MSIAELRDAGVEADVDGLMFAGGYPRVHADHLDPTVTQADYFATHVERDLRQLVALRSLVEFSRFVRLAAGRVGQVVNLHSLVSDVGISDPTAREW
jgi:predicted AAA+ superfamily ATPase